MMAAVEGGIFVVIPKAMGSAFLCAAGDHCSEMTTDEGVGRTLPLQCNP